MRCSNRGEWLGNISSTQARSKECSKVVGFSLLELFTLHNPPPLQIASFFSPHLSLSFGTKDFTKHTHTHTHTRHQCGMAAVQRGAPVSFRFQRALCSLSFWCSLRRQQRSRNAERQALIWICPSFSTPGPATLQPHSDKKVPPEVRIMKSLGLETQNCCPGRRPAEQVSRLFCFPCSHSRWRMNTKTSGDMTASASPVNADAQTCTQPSD